MTPGNNRPGPGPGRMETGVSARLRLAEDRGFEPLRAFTQHAFQVCDGQFIEVRQPLLSVESLSASNCGRVRTRTTETRTETERAAFSAVSRAVPELGLFRVVTATCG